MRIAIQGAVLRRMEIQTRAAVRKIEDEALDIFLDHWKCAKSDMRDAIMREYHADFGRKQWNIRQANQKDTLGKISRATWERIKHFKADVKQFFPEAMNAMAREETLRQMWMLDALTPPSRRLRAPMVKSREADAPQDYEADWWDALDAWMDAYHLNLISSLKMEALHEGTIHDAADEVEATMIDGFDPVSKLTSLFTNQSLLVQQQARDSVVDSNGGGGVGGIGGIDSINGEYDGDVINEEIWQTMEDGDVCPVCAPYDGQPYDSVGDEIPAHFNCRCFTRIVPKQWAELLRSGNAEDKELALKMDDKGLVPDAMAIRGPDGQIDGTVTVTFSDWVDGRGADFAGMNITGGVK